MRRCARCQSEVPNAGVEGQEDDLRFGEVVAEHAGDFEPGHAWHRVVEDD